MDAIYLSPHLDDVVFSCGGQIHRFVAAGQEVLVFTMTAGDPDPGMLSPCARELHRKWTLDDGGAVGRRREEDRAACAVLGAESLHGDALDALYRVDPATGRPFYPSLEAIRSRPADADRVVDAWCERLRELPSAPRVIAPLGAGRHVDHLFLRRAAERVFERLEYYEDYPYSRSWWLLRKARGWRGGWRERVWELGGEDLDAKCRAMERYASQFPSAFADVDDLRRQVLDAAEWRGGERLWVRG